MPSDKRKKSFIETYRVEVNYRPNNNILKWETTVCTNGGRLIKESSYFTSRGAKQGGKRMALRAAKRRSAKDRRDEKQASKNAKRRENNNTFEHEVWL
jgi:phosphate starvation-inducible protein PhoH